MADDLNETHGRFYYVDAVTDGVGRTRACGSGTVDSLGREYCRDSPPNGGGLDGNRPRIPRTPWDVDPQRAPLRPNIANSMTVPAIAMGSLPRVSSPTGAARRSNYYRKVNTRRSPPASETTRCESRTEGNSMTSKITHGVRFLKWASYARSLCVGRARTRAADPVEL